MPPTTSDRKYFMEELLPPHIEPGENVFGYGEVEVNKWPAGQHPVSIRGTNQQNASVILTDLLIAA